MYTETLTALVYVFSVPFTPTIIMTIEGKALKSSKDN